MSSVQRKDDKAIWCCVEFHLKDIKQKPVAISYSTDFIYQIEAVDEQSRRYQLHNWESGVLSGALYVLRKHGMLNDKYIVMDKLAGRLGAADMDGIAFAATLEVARQLNQENMESALWMSHEWRVV